MRVPKKKALQPVHAYVNINVSDLPASRKAAGLRGVTSDDFMCHVCKKTLSSLVDHECFDDTSMCACFECS